MTHDPYPDVEGFQTLYEKCKDKNRYTHKEAERAKKFVGLRRGKDTRIYECDKCHGWHLTKKYRE